MAPAARPPLRIGLAGFGNIGGALVREVCTHPERTSARFEMPIEFTAIAMRNLRRRRGVPPPPGARRTTDPLELATDPAVDVVVEVMGGVEESRRLAEATLSAGRDLVTANKAMLAECGPELARIAEANGCRLLFEASVGAGIPIIRSIESGLLSNRINAVTGIVNGTTNYILTRMDDRRGASFEEMLAEASRLGYAEPDPSLDVDGHDSAHKLAVLAALCFGQSVRPADVRTEGIRHITPEDIAWGAIQGLSIRLLASARLREDGRLHLSVAPSFVPNAHPLAAVRGVLNGVCIEAEPFGALFMSGPGAGQGSTVTGLLSDIGALAADRANGRRGGRALLARACGRRDLLPKTRSLPDSYLRVVHPEVPMIVNKLERRMRAECVERGAEDAAYLLPPMKLTAFERALGTLDGLGISSSRRSKVEFALGSRSQIDADWKK